MWRSANWHSEFSVSKEMNVFNGLRCTVPYCTVWKIELTVDNAYDTVFKTKIIFLTHCLTPV